MTFPLALLLSGLTGLIALSSELVWYRAWSFASAGRAAAFGALLGFYLLGVAVGSLVSGRLCQDRDPAGVRTLLRPVSCLVLAASVLGFLAIPVLAQLSRYGSWSTSLPLVALATALMGTIFPLISHVGIASDDRAGARVSYLYVANIVGSASGSLLTGFVLMDVWSLRTIATVVAVTGLALAGGVLLLAGPSRRDLATGGAILGVTAVAIVGLGPRLYHHVYEKLQLNERYNPARPFAHVVETRSGVITVTDDGLIYGGGAYDGAFQVDLHHDRNGLIRAFAVAAMHPAPRQVLMVGLSSGSWARVIAAFPSVEHLTIIEINPGYLALVRLYPGGDALLANPKVSIVIDDGRRWLRRHPEARFDAIVQNTTWHWRAHMTNLLSREFLELVRAHLRQGGLFYFNTTYSGAAQKTAAVVYPHSWRVENFVAVSDAPMAFDKARWRQVLTPFQLEGRPLLNLELPADRAVLEKVLALADDVDGLRTGQGLETHAHMLARLADAPVITDDNMLTEW